MMRYPMTKEGYNKLLEERNDLKTIKLPHILKEVQIAREQGDLSENAEYKFGKEAQRNIERKIAEIDAKLSNAEIIDLSDYQGNQVIFGATVKLIDVETNEEVTYKIVGEDEADIQEGKISYTAPLAQKAIGKEVGEEIEIKSAKGNRTLEILEILYN